MTQAVPVGKCSVFDLTLYRAGMNNYSSKLEMTTADTIDNVNQIAK